MNRLMAMTDIGWIVPRDEPFTFVTSPPSRIGDECLIAVEGRKWHVIWLRLKFKNGRTGRSFYRRMLVDRKSFS